MNVPLKIILNAFDEINLSVVERIPFEMTAYKRTVKYFKCFDFHEIGCYPHDKTLEVFLILISMFNVDVFFVIELKKHEDTSFMKMLNTKGPSSDPWVIPEGIKIDIDVSPLGRTA